MRRSSVDTNWAECKTCCIVKSIMHKLRLEAMLYDIDVMRYGVWYLNDSLLPARLERG